jgi:hypothetical protein
MGDSFPLAKLGSETGKLSLQETLSLAAGDAQNEQVIRTMKEFSVGDLREALAITRAKLELAQHPFGKRPLPEDVLARLQVLPATPRVVRLLNEGNRLDAYYQEFDTYARASAAEGKFTSSATAMRSTKVVDIHPVDRVKLKSILNHEQVHLNHSDLYPIARHFDAKKEATRYGHRNELESEAELESQAFLGDKETFLGAIDEAPVRMALLSQKLRATVTKGAPDLDPRVRQAILQRADIVDELALPEANKILLKHIHGDSSAEREDAFALLSRLNETPKTPEVIDAHLIAATKFSRQSAELAIAGIARSGDKALLQPLHAQRIFDRIGLFPGADYKSSVYTP